MILWAEVFVHCKINLPKNSVMKNKICLNKMNSAHLFHFFFRLTLACFLFQIPSNLMAQNNSIFYGGNGGGSGITCLTIPVVLPIELVYFEVNCDEQSIVLNWQTASEVNSSSFVIERSEDGSVFDAIGQLDAAGNSSFEINYSFTDRHIPPGTHYYRLRQLDMDGSAVYSSVKSASTCLQTSVLIYPNPTSESCDLNFGKIISNGQLIVRNSLGQIILSSFFEDTSAIQLSTVSLSAGTYVVEIYENGFICEIMRFVKV